MLHNCWEASFTSIRARIAEYYTSRAYYVYVSYVNTTVAFKSHIHREIYTYI